MFHVVLMLMLVDFSVCAPQIIECDMIPKGRWRHTPRDNITGVHMTYYVNGNGIRVKWFAIDRDDFIECYNTDESEKLRFSAIKEFEKVNTSFCFSCYVVHSETNRLLLECPIETRLPDGLDDTLLDDTLLDDTLARIIGSYYVYIDVISERVTLTFNWEKRFEKCGWVDRITYQCMVDHTRMNWIKVVSIVAVVVVPILSACALSYIVAQCINCKTQKYLKIITAG